MTHHSCHGFSLIEVIVAMFLSSLLLLTIVALTADLTRHAKLQHMLADFLDRQRYLSFILPHRIRQAGLRSCVSDAHHASVAIEGFGSGKSLPRWLTQRKSHTDALIVTGCQKYKGRSQYISMAYYVAKTSHRDWLGRSLYALYQKPYGGRREELVPGVEDLTINYGVRKNANNSVDHYVAAKDVSSWDQVAIVSINIVMRSILPIQTQASEQVFFGKAYYVPSGVVFFDVPLYIALRE
jgi:prepilin-type N-terminal cleavage/methylation domain-containing protein